MSATPPLVGEGILRSRIDAAKRELRLPLKSLTVLDSDRDPYRLDTPANHQKALWFVAQLKKLGYETNHEKLAELAEPKTIHLRGAHYGTAVQGNVRKPSGAIYDNTEKDWDWFQEEAARCARWLSYVPFELIIDARNEKPVIHRRPETTPYPYVNVGVEVEIPDADDIQPTVDIEDFTGHQCFHLCIFGEKTSLETILLPITKRFDADLYLPTGGISDTLLYRMAMDGARDGRALLVFTFSDFDPSGWQMPISIGRKLQALRDLYFPVLNFQVIPVGLTLAQVKRFKLPETPLKPTELRADAWVEAHGHAQTEIDAMIALKPDDLRQIATDAIAPYYEATLDGRVAVARQAWRAKAQADLESRLDGEMVELLRDQAAVKLAELEREIDALNRALRSTTDGLDLALPAPVVPKAEPPVICGVGGGCPPDLHHRRMGHGDEGAHRAQALRQRRGLSRCPPARPSVPIRSSA